MLLNPQHIRREYKNVSYSSVKKLMRAGKQKKYGFKDYAVEVVQVDDKHFDVVIEYVI